MTNFCGQNQKQNFVKKQTKKGKIIPVTNFF